MSIFIANPTKQRHVFHFRLPESDRASYVEIESGTQVELGKGWAQSHIDRVVSHLQLFGGKPATEMSRRLDHFSGLIYRLDRAIKEDEIQIGHEAIVETQERRSAKEATAAAVAFDKHANPGKGKRRAKKTQVEVEQVVPERTKTNGDEIKFSVEVNPEGQDRLN